MAIIGGVILSRRLREPQLELVVDNELQKRNEAKEIGEYRTNF